MTDPFNKDFPARPKLIFMGTPDFALPTLNALIDYPHKGLTVVTQPDRAKGRGKKVAPPPVKALALEKGIEVLQPEKISDKSFIEQIRSNKPDLMIVVAFGQILPKSLLTLPGWGVINIHASLLPKYRGAAPIQRAILDDACKTGLTVMAMDEGLDTGPILLQEEVPIQENETAGQLHDRLAHLGGDLMSRFLHRLAGEPVYQHPQDPEEATYADKIGRHMSEIDWQQTASRISALIRALDPKPGARTNLQGKDIKLFSSRVVDAETGELVPGRIKAAKAAGLQVETGKGIVEIGEIQAPGKKKLSVADFLRGFPLPEAAILG